MIKDFKTSNQDIISDNQLYSKFIQHLTTGCNSSHNIHISFNKMNGNGNDKYGKIILVQFGRLGESIWVLPIARELRKKNPNSEIIFLVTNKGAYEIFKSINDDIKFIYFDIGKIKTLDWAEQKSLINKYLESLSINNKDLVINLGRLRESFLFTGMIDDIYKCSVIGVFEDKKGITHINGDEHLIYATLYSSLKICMKHDLEIHARKANVVAKQYKTLISHTHNPENKVGFAIGASNNIRIWNSENYISLAEYIKENYQSEILFFGNKEEKEIIDGKVVHSNRFNYLFDKDLNEQVEYLSKCKVLITNDSGLMHLASSLSVPTIIISGPTLPFRTGSFNGKNISVVMDYDCMPCYHVNCDSLDCIKDVSIDSVKNVVDYFLGNKNLNKPEGNVIYYKSEGMYQNDYKAIYPEDVNPLRITKEIVNYCTSDILLEESKSLEDISAHTLKEIKIRYSLSGEQIQKIKDELTIVVSMLNATIDSFKGFENDIECFSGEDMHELISEVKNSLHSSPYYIQSIFEFYFVSSNIEHSTNLEDAELFMKKLIDKTTLTIQALNYIINSLSN